MSGSSAPGAHSAKRRPPGRRTIEDPRVLLDRAIRLRGEWLGRALCTLPADRPTAEAAISTLYEMVGQGPPRFVWVESPHAATLPGRSREPLRLRAATAPVLGSDWPFAARLASLTSSLRSGLDARTRRRGLMARWPFHPATRTIGSFPPQESLREGLSLEEVLRATVEDSLNGSVHEALGGPLRAALASEHTPGLTWYGQHDAHWIGNHQIRRALGRAYTSLQNEQLDVWTAIAGSCGWWWPREDVCVVSERPVAVHTEPVLGSVHGEVRPHSGKGHAIRYADGWGVHSWHGTRVPEWVVAEPTVDRIVAEPNAEVRRCAIERIGWDVFIERAGLNLVSTAPDPGNPGCELRLYDMPARLWGGATRVLLAVNGSVERDGTRRRYGLSVPAAIADPVSAAGWSYGLTGAQYSTLLRRT